GAFCGGASFGQSFGRCAHHFETAGRVHIEQLQAGKFSSRSNRPCDCIRNVVIFEIEKNTGAECGDFAHSFGSGRSEKVNIDFEHADQIGEGAGKLNSLVQAAKVQRQNELTAG